jgi:hypothetical protein
VTEGGGAAVATHVTQSKPSLTQPRSQEEH